MVGGILVSSPQSRIIGWFRKALKEDGEFGSPGADAVKTAYGAHVREGGREREERGREGGRGEESGREERREGVEGEREEERWKKRWWCDSRERGSTCRGRGEE